FVFFATKEVFLLDASHVIAYYERQSTRKSIKKADIEHLGHLVNLGFHPRIDYLETVERIYFQSSIKGEKLDGR
uniref:Holliday junction resolvase RecU n=1 Tax=Bacillus sp. JCM 19041 TaxID=1460637 RepID=UPI0018D1CBAB